MPTSFPTDGTAPWSTSSVSYAGWVPNVLGHLSFSLVGLKGRWGHSRTLNHTVDSNGTRSIAVRQNRIAQDYPYWDFLVRIFKPAAEQSYLLVASTHPAKIPFLKKTNGAEQADVRVFKDGQGLLAGTVFVTPKNRDKSVSKIRKIALNQIDKLLSRRTSDATDICAEVSDVLGQGNGMNFPSIAYRFALFRTGEVRIWLEEQTHLLDWTRQAGAKKVIEETFPKQVYYFLKDTLHTHYHHEPDSDQLLPLTQMKELPDNDEDREKENEVAWRRETLWGLARVISSYRRSNTIKSLRRAQGVLAYADAFQATVARVFRPATLENDPKFDDDLTTYDFAHTKQSVSALEGLRTWRNTGGVQLLAGLTAFALAAFTVWSSALRLKIAKCSNQKADGAEVLLNCGSVASQRADLVLGWIVDHPLVFAGSMLVPSAFIYSIIVWDIRDLPIARKFSRFLSAAARAIGASVGRKFSNPIIGFFATIISLLLVTAALLFSFAYLGSVMQSR
ncbi:MAG: hypothetical protein AAGL68_06185 [Pseudomonadota bacterium]